MASSIPPLPPIRAIRLVEGVNARDLTAADLGGALPDLIVCDVSFISLRLALPPALGLARPGCRCLALVKPQFEAGRAALGKGGMVRAPAAAAAAEALRAWLDGQPGWRALGLARVADRRRRRQPRVPARRDQGPVSTTLTIERLGAQGDGIAAGAAGAVYVPFTLPGETVTVARAAIGARAELLDVITPSSQRVTPPCRHFGSCGGCALQQFEPSAYLAWKRDKVGEALRREGIEAPLAPIVACAPGSRRRIVLSARRAGGRVLLGYNRALSHDIVDIVECPIAEPALGGGAAVAAPIGRTARAAHRRLPADRHRHR